MTTIMEALHSCLAALRAKLEGNDLALHTQAAAILEKLSPSAYTHCFPEDHDHAAVAAQVGVNQAQREATRKQIPSEASVVDNSAIVAAVLAEHVAGQEDAPAAAPVDPDPPTGGGGDSGGGGASADV